MRLHRETGFSLTELLISLIMISAGVVGFASAVGLISKEMNVGRRDTEVALLASNQLETLKSLGHDAVSPGSLVEGQYQLSWTVEGSDPKKLVLVVTYPEDYSSYASDTLVSYIPAN